MLWLKETPDAQIRVAGIGFSRGAEQAAGFARLLHERGIQDPEGMRTTRDERGNVVIEFTKPPLVPPGSIAQAVGLFDPVGTGEPRDHDRRLPPSVVSGFQITALHERRNLFQSTQHLDPGMTADGRFLNVGVAGAHSDIGGSYVLDGLAVRSGNLMIDYLNGLSEPPFLRKQALPPPERDVIHRSEEHQRFYRTSVFEELGRRGFVDTLAPHAVCRIVADCRNAEAVDPAIDGQFPRRPTPIGPVPAGSPDSPSAAAPRKDPLRNAENAAGPDGSTQEPTDPKRTRVRDPRDRNHPDHAMNESIRAKLAALHADHGIELAGDRLERMTAAVALSARERQMTRVDGMMFSVGRDGKPDPDGNLLAYQAVNGDPYHYATMRSATPVQQAQQTVPEEAYRQMAQATQQQAQQAAQFEEQRQRAETQQRSGSGPVLA